MEKNINMSYAGLLDKYCNIQRRTATQDASGQKVYTWANVITSIKCRLETSGGGKVTAPTQIFKDVTHILYLNDISSYEITSRDYRVVVGSQTYEILLVQFMKHSEIFLRVAK